MLQLCEHMLSSDIFGCFFKLRYFSSEIVHDLVKVKSFYDCLGTLFMTTTISGIWEWIFRSILFFGRSSPRCKFLISNLSTKWPLKIIFHNFRLYKLIQKFLINLIKLRINPKMSKYFPSFHHWVEKFLNQKCYPMSKFIQNCQNFL